MKKFAVTLLSVTTLAVLLVLAGDVQGQKSQGERLDAIPDDSIAILFEDDNGELKQITLDGTISDPVSTDLFQRFVPEKGKVSSIYNSYEYVIYKEVGLGYSQDFSLGNIQTGEETLLLHLPGSLEDENFRDYPRPYPNGWVSPDEVLVTEGGIETFYEGLARYNVRTNEYKSLNIKNAYGQYVNISPNGKWALGRYNSDGYYDSAHGTVDKTALINLETGEERTLFDHTRVKGWIVTHKKYEKLNSAPKAGFSFVECDNGENCLLPGAPVMYLPFECGRAYAVSRDGSCNSPAICGLAPSTTAYASWHNFTDAHGRPALDFSDNQLAGTSSPGVYASTSGTVSYAGWQSADTGVGFGLYVRINHNNGSAYTYYGHMSSLAVSVGQTVSVGQLLGYEGNTGFSSGEHIHFELRDQNALNNDGLNHSFWPLFHETGALAVPQQGYIYTSQNGSVLPGQCALCCGILFCEDATEISCNQTVSGNRPSGTGGYVSTYLSEPLSYSGPATWNLDGEEILYKVLVDPGEFTVTLTHETNDLDVFVFRDDGDCSLDPLTECVGVSCGMLCGNNPPGTHTVVVSVADNPTGGYYYVVVDGVSVNASNFTLEVLCSGEDGPCTPFVPTVDLTVSFLNSTWTTNGSWFSLDAGVQNVGTGTVTDDFYVSAFLIPIEEQYFSFAWGRLVDNVFVTQNIGPGQIVEFSLSGDCANRGIPSGQYKVVLVIDMYPFNLVKEIVPGQSNFTTNDVEVVTILPSSSKPDFDVGQLDEGFNGAVPEGSVQTYHYKIINEGDGGYSGPLEVAVFFNSASNSYNQDNGQLVSAIEEVFVDLSPGERSDWFSIDFTIPLGLCFSQNNNFCVYVDPNNLVDEAGLEGGNQQCDLVEIVSGSSEVLGCIYPTACNYNPNATQNDGSCEFPDGCTDPGAENYNPSANCDDGSCEYPCPGDFSEDGFVGSGDLIALLAGFGCGPPGPCLDLNGDGSTTTADVIVFLSLIGDVCE